MRNLKMKYIIWNRYLAKQTTMYQRNLNQGYSYCAKSKMKNGAVAIIRQSDRLTVR